jgi:hypothetical protein
MTGGPALSAIEGREARNDSGGEVVGPWAVSRLGPERCPAAFSIFFYQNLYSFLFFKGRFCKKANLNQTRTKICKKIYLST